MTNPKNEMPASIARALGTLSHPQHTPYQKAHTLHLDANAFMRLGQPWNAIKACEQGLAILDAQTRLTPIMRDLKKNLQRNLARAQAKQPYA